MIGTGSQRNRIVDGPIAVDCSKDVRSWSLIRSLVELMVPCCVPHSMSYPPSEDAQSTLGSTITGTFFGYRKSRVSFCVQEDSGRAPLLLLEFAIPTCYLAKEMRSGLLRIALECDRPGGRAGSLFSVPAWTMYCNGRKVGYAIRRQMSETDASILKMMRSVSVGAGVLPAESKSGDGELMFLRASFERIAGSPDSESFHLINPDGNSSQELSIFLLRS
ncbi:protein MIZU-KUSSEI 1-like [Nymphaea colorata]|uniref:Protein MIZU-KUSSEI 1 n=1 Tax=Nymphaea colorata TaxID=210225 RepID=A0A5K0VIL4_9MAGN|nr:protein MIZU-KUSSEI 1-like [Nymphaea colorata]